MRHLFYILTVLFFSSCTTNYYLCTVDKPVVVYQTQDTTQNLFSIASGKQLIAKKKDKKFRAVKIGDKEGYILSKTFLTEKKIPQKKLNYLLFNADSTYTDSRLFSYTGNSNKSNNTKSSSSSNTSSTSGTNNTENKTSSSNTSNSSSSNTNSSSGTVEVKGYYRKDGTYVKPHTRSAPKRKG